MKLRKKGYAEIKVGIALHYADVLMIKAGYSGSGINEVTWIGKLVGETAELCSKANRLYVSQRTLYSSTFYDNLSDKKKKDMNWITWNQTHQCYEADTINSMMQEWVTTNG